MADEEKIINPTKSVLISINPKWCKLIANGEKTVEVRKSRPKLETPFKCYIYCTKGKELWRKRNRVFFNEQYNRLIDDLPDYLPNKKVMGEFICDKIYQYSTVNVDGVDISDEDMIRFSCLSKEELCNYETSAEPKENCIYLVGLYGWHILNLVIYDEPIELNEFRQCHRCPYGGYENCVQHDYSCSGEYKLTRPPQSWCYVQEAGNDQN